MTYHKSLELIGHAYFTAVTLLTEQSGPEYSAADVTLYDVSGSGSLSAGRIPLLRMRPGYYSRIFSGTNRSLNGRVDTRDTRDTGFSGVLCLDTRDTGTVNRAPVALIGLSAE